MSLSTGLELQARAAQAPVKQLMACTHLEGCGRGRLGQVLCAELMQHLLWGLRGGLHTAQVHKGGQAQTD